MEVDHVVKFSSPSEWLEEIKRDGAYVQRGLVRLTQRAQSDRLGLTETVTIVGTAVVMVPDGVRLPGVVSVLLRLDRFVGQREREPVRPGGPTAKTDTQAQGLVASLDKELTALGLEVRAGVIERGAL